jgi:GNAT superfamily N-acetyltransferase
VDAEVAANIAITAVDPAEPAAQHCLREYYAELDRRFDSGYDPQQAVPVELDEMRAPDGTFLVATRHGEPVACGALKRSGDAHVEVKRMWVSPTVRGMGLGRWLLRELERAAAAMGARAVRLDSHSALTEALAMYRSSGYREVADFNGDIYADHWFEKPLEPTDRDDPQGPASSVPAEPTTERT